MTASPRSAGAKMSATMTGGGGEMGSRRARTAGPRRRGRRRSPARRGTRWRWRLLVGRGSTPGPGVSPRRRRWRIDSEQARVLRAQIMTMHPFHARGQVEAVLGVVRDPVHHERVLGCAAAWVVVVTDPFRDKGLVNHEFEMAGFRCRLRIWTCPYCLGLVAVTFCCLDEIDGSLLERLCQ